MHDVGQKVVAALNSMFPALRIEGYESNYRQMLVMSFETGGTMRVIRTPPETDYRKHDYQRWVHQAADVIRERSK